MKSIFKILVLFISMISFSYAQSVTPENRLRGDHMNCDNNKSYYYIQHSPDEEIASASWTVTGFSTWINNVNLDPSMIVVTWNPNALTRSVRLNYFLLKDGTRIDVNKTISVASCGYSTGAIYTNSNSNILGGGATTVSDQSFCINGTFTLNTSNDFKFSNCTIYLGSGAKIATSTGCGATFENCRIFASAGSSIELTSLLSQLSFLNCNIESKDGQQWEGISVSKPQGFSVTGTRIADAKKSISLTDNVVLITPATTYIKNNIFESSGGNHSIYLYNFTSSKKNEISGNIFRLSSNTNTNIVRGITTSNYNSLSGKLYIYNNVFKTNYGSSIYLEGGKVNAEISGNKMSGDYFDLTYIWGCSSSNINIHHNHIKGTRLFGIELIDVNNSTISVDYNNIKGGSESRGILLYNCSGPSVNIEHNYIESSWPAISMDYTPNALVIQNRIMKAPGVTDLCYGIDVYGDCPNTYFKCNEIHNYDYGFYLEGSIPNQGTPSIPSGNSWFNCGTNIYGYVTTPTTWYWGGSKMTVILDDGSYVSGTFSPNAVSNLTLSQTINWPDCYIGVYGSSASHSNDPEIAYSFNNELPAAELNVYPNPASDKITIQNDANASRIVIYDAMGKQLLDRSLQDHPGSINVGEWSAGLYIYSFYDHSNNILKTGKLQIAR